jgi:cold shock CspA family protein
VPTRQTLTSRKEDKTFEEAIRAAFDAVAIELRKYRDKRADKVARIEPLPQLRGVVSKIFPNQGYGFILNDGGGEVYFHKNALKGISFDEVQDGLEVLFESEPGEKGLHATIVQTPHLLKP